MKGIPMTPDNHKAIRDKLKTQTRRLNHLKEINKEPSSWNFCGNAVRIIPPVKIGDSLFQHADGHCISVRPPYRTGETVYIKEAWCLGAYTYKKTADIIYKLGTKCEVDVLSVGWNDWLEKHTTYGGSNVVEEKWRSPMFMPSWAARTFLKITDVRPERLNDITFEDCLAEGIVHMKEWQTLDYKAPEPLHPEDLSNEEADREISLGWVAYARQACAKLWDSINGKTYPFDGDYWAWHICFELAANRIAGMEVK